MGALQDGLGRRLQQLRKNARLTQEQLAGAANIDPKYLGSVERGEKSPSLEVLERLILALKVEPYEPFLFSLGRRKAIERSGDDALLALIRNSDPSAKILVMHLAESVLNWAQGKKI